MDSRSAGMRSAKCGFNKDPVCLVNFWSVSRTKARISATFVDMKPGKRDGRMDGRREGRKEERKEGRKEERKEERKEGGKERGLRKRITKRKKT